jgi:hypothetical protein
MLQEIAIQWSAALRSGKYQQCKDYLAVAGKDGSTSYCCLGVLCDIAIENGVEVEKLKAPLGQWPFKYKDSTSCEDTVLPAAVRNWAELVNNIGTFQGDLTIEVEGEKRIEGSLADLNDNGIDFKNIADIIDQHWEAL